MDLPFAAMTAPADDSHALFTRLRSSGNPDNFEGTSASRRHPARPFDDILGQTLAGPLFAMWTPPLPVAPVASSSAGGSSTAAPIDPNARRDGRRRSRR
jgi:hypothetical protein